MPFGGSGAEQSALGAVDGIFNHDGLVPARAKRDNGYGHFHKVSQEAQIVHRGPGQVFKLAAILR